MNIFKKIVSVLLVISGIGGFLKGDILPSLFTTILGLILYPDVSENIKKSFIIWKNKGVRYAGYLLLLLIAGASIKKKDIAKDSTEKNIVSTTQKPKKKKVRIINLDDKFWDANGNIIKPTKDDITYRVIEVLKHGKTGEKGSRNASEYMHLLIKTSSYDKDVLKKIAITIKKRYSNFAPKRSNIDLWDNKKAYQKYMEREKYFKTSFDKLMKEFERTRKPIGDKHNKIKENWDKKNYPFIADHYPVSISFDGVFYYYPFHDKHYIDVGGKNSKN